MNHSLAVSKKREEKLKKEIVDLRDKVGDFGFRIDYLDCKVNLRTLWSARDRGPFKPITKDHVRGDTCMAIIYILVEHNIILIDR